MIYMFTGLDVYYTQFSLRKYLENTAENQDSSSSSVIAGAVANRDC